MKRLFTLIALFCIILGAVAQTHGLRIWKDGAFKTYMVSYVDSITFEKLEYAVDLGLPSGTLWADRNVGADSPEDYGEYFAWGETEPKDSYDWSTYKWCNGSSEKLTKYCIDSSYGYNGFTDGKTTLEPADDAATANWGGRWCMPTFDQFCELLLECEWVWTSKNGVMGSKVIGPNGEAIFLPAASYFENSYIGYAGSSTYFWTSSLDDREPSSAFSCGSFPGFTIQSSENRYVGYTVRAVVK